MSEGNVQNMKLVKKARVLHCCTFRGCTYLTLKALIMLYQLMECLRSLYEKQYESKSDCSYRSGSTLFASIV